MKCFHLISIVFMAISTLLVPVRSAVAQELCVRVSRANLRAGPGTDNKKTWEVYQFMPFTQIDKKGDWYKVRDVDGDEHWIFKNLVDSKLQCVTIKAERANVRKGPGTNYEMWFTVEKYTSFKKIGAEGKWVKVEYEGEVMWIFNTLTWP